MKKTGIFCLILLLFGYFFSLNLKAESFNNEVNFDYNTNKYIVVFNEEISSHEEIIVENLSYDNRFEKIEKLTENHNETSSSYRSIFEVTIAEGEENIVETVNYLISRDDVVSVCPNCEIELADTTCNDTKYVEQKLVHELIGLPKAWDICTGDYSVKVGIIDTGIEGKHSDLKDQIDNELSRDFTYGDCREVTVADDYHHHGTHVAGIVGAKGNNANGVSGVCWNVTLVSLAAIDAGGDLLSNVIRAIDFAEEKNIPIINLSLKWYQANYPNVNVKEVYTSALKNYSGLAICAAGNENLNNDGTNPCFPASVELDNVISVGNSDINDNKATSSNYGKKSVDLFAPGQNIYSTYIYNSYKTLSGTSMAAPFVTGVAALLLSKYPSMTPSEIKTTILNNVDKVSALSNYCVTGGRLNAYKALSNPHFHSYSNYIPNGDSNHIRHCSTCGYDEETKHNFSGGYCSRCRMEHDCEYQYAYRDRISHILTCSCGLTTGNPAAHVTKKTSGNKAICLVCKAELDLNSDIVIVPGVNKLGRYVSSKGSYIMDNGIIVLVDEDVEAYFNGTLVFNYSYVSLS